MFAPNPQLNSFYSFDPFNVNCYFHQEITFIFKFKYVGDMKHFLLSQYINNTCQTQLVKGIVKEKHRCGISSQYLNS